jgi:hypothetical protein
MWRSPVPINAPTEDEAIKARRDDLGWIALYAASFVDRNRKAVQPVDTALWTAAGKDVKQTCTEFRPGWDGLAAPTVEFLERHILPSLHILVNAIPPNVQVFGALDIPVDGSVQCERGAIGNASVRITLGEVRDPIFDLNTLDVIGYKDPEPFMRIDVLSQEAAPLAASVEAPSRRDN